MQGLTHWDDIDVYIVYPVDLSKCKKVYHTRKQSEPRCDEIEIRIANAKLVLLVKTHSQFGILAAKGSDVTHQLFDIRKAPRWQRFIGK